MSSVSCITKDTLMYVCMHKFVSFFPAIDPRIVFSLCISSRLKGAARNKTYTSVQLAHSEEHQQHVEVVLTYLLTDLSVEERRIGKGQCTLESGLVCPALKSSQLVSGTVRCLVWWSWWYFVQSVASTYSVLIPVVCFIHIKFTVLISVRP